MKRDIKNTMAAMEGLPVTIRLLDPPLHEFVPQSADKQAELAKALKIKVDDVRKRGEALHESNPMMGHRGVRLGVTFPEITEMQVRAIFEAAAELNKAKKEVQARNHGSRHLRCKRDQGSESHHRPRARRGVQKDEREGNCRTWSAP